MGGCAVTDADGAARAARARLPLGDLLLVGFRGTALDGNEELRSLLCETRAGGVILFERDVATRTPRNIESALQVAQLTSDMQALARRCAGRPLLIAADAEGGQVMRLSARLGYLPSPSPQELGAQGDLAQTELEARRMGATLRNAGINWNLAPVVDVAVNPANPAVVTLGRTFSSDPERVIAHAKAFVTGMREAGILTSLKHFPGHGSSRQDSHLGFTDVSETAELDVELAPYRALVHDGYADSIMTAHVFNRRLDPWHPATLSRFTIDRLLRRKLGYQGLVVSDDLLMGAIIQHYGVAEAAVQALGAGVDMVLISHNTIRHEPQAAMRALAEIRRALGDGRLSRKRVEASLARIDRFRSRLAP
jgi:beta-N-acetylhexosaminidase